MLNKISPELQKQIDVGIKYLIDKWGLWLVFAIVLILIILGVFLNILLNLKFERAKVELSKSAQKNFELWNVQKELTFEFVEFLEIKVLNNSNLNKEKDVVLKELNRYYGKLYLILDTNILKNISDLIDSRVDITQRYYIYREIRKQLLSVLRGTKVGNEECPYISIDIDKVKVLPNQKKPKTIEDLKKIYPFVEKGDRKNTYKSLPFFKAKVLNFEDNQE